MREKNTTKHFCSVRGPEFITSSFAALLEVGTTVFAEESPKVLRRVLWFTNRAWESKAVTWTTGASAARVMCERPSTANAREALSVNLGLQELVQQGRKKKGRKEVATCGGKVVTGLAFFSSHAKKFDGTAVTDGLPLWEGQKSHIN